MCMFVLFCCSHIYIYGHILKHVKSHCDLALTLLSLCKTMFVYIIRAYNQFLKHSTKYRHRIYQCIFRNVLNKWAFSASILLISPGRSYFGMRNEFNKLFLKEKASPWALALPLALWIVCSNSWSLLALSTPICLT